MVAVHKNDQILSYYPSTPHQQKVFYKKIFRHLVDMAVLNGESGGKDTHLDFRMSLLEAPTAANVQPGSRRKMGRSSDNLLSRLIEHQFPSAPRFDSSGKRAIFFDDLATSATDTQQRT
ncbi:hypothetical protein HPB47_025698 [Ixodes persulcatus]|uniref:Uncharacterized protein n=1 Tax=Ixodes persulcatus TaxID=34615 RepID=A0AC60Q0R9_IXOPE|nr:hypothetical protein HPB47_025698 [Ixodes persulcatus]